MKERVLYPQNSNEIIKELTTPNSEEIDQFSKQFPKEIVDFSESFSDAYKKYLELVHCCKKDVKNGDPISKKDFVRFFCYQILDNLLTSYKTLLMGFSLASGNLMRQVAEGTAVVMLCAANCSIKRKYNKSGKSKTMSFNFFEKFKDDRSYARAHCAINLLEENKEILNISDYGIEILKELKKYHNIHSHPNYISTSAFISFGDPGKMYLGGCFDAGKIEWYKSELGARNYFCMKIPNLIDGLILQLSQERKEARALNIK
jgi:uncharacterized protein YxeA